MPPGQCPGVRTPSPTVSGWPGASQVGRASRPPTCSSWGPLHPGPQSPRSTWPAASDPSPEALPQGARDPGPAGHRTQKRIEVSQASVREPSPRPGEDTGRRADVFCSVTGAKAPGWETHPPAHTLASHRASLPDATRSNVCAGNSSPCRQSRAGGGRRGTPAQTSTARSSHRQLLRSQ